MILINAPNRLTPPLEEEQSYPLINDNFDKVLTNISQLQPRSFGSPDPFIFTLGASNTFVFWTTFIDQPSYNDFAAVLPEIDIRIDINNIATNGFPFGSSLTAAQKKLWVSTWLMKSVDTTVTGVGVYTKPLATMVVMFYNFDSSSHTIYLYSGGEVFSGVTTGVFR